MGNVERNLMNPMNRHEPMNRPGSALSLVHNAIVTCNRCPRLRAYCTRVGEVKKAAHRDDVYWARPVPGFGDPAARLVVIGLAPAAHGANRTGRVFTGDGPGSSGDFLMRAMHAAGFASIPTSCHPDDGLVLRDAFIAAAVRCAPPDNKPLPSEAAACRPHLEAACRLLELRDADVAGAGDARRSEREEDARDPHAAHLSKPRCGPSSPARRGGASGSSR